MDRCPDHPKLRFHVDQAMTLVRQDRWLVGAVREGKLKVIADSSPDPDRPYRRTRPLSHLARRCLHERRPLTLSAVAELDPSIASAGDWEMDWPALLYAPVGLPAQRPAGLLVVGSRTDHWYQQPEIDYVAALGVTLSSLVLALGGPLTRLDQRELAMARLIAQGCSVAETSTALHLGLDEARELVGGVLRKLALRSPGELADVWPRLEPLGGFA
jgi:DNA-binding CsgD family transcriptional regulator